jgi:hypothetical protein
MKERAAKIGSDQISVYEARKVLEFLLDDISSDKYGVFLEAIKNLIKRLDSYEKNDKKFIP